MTTLHVLKTIEFLKVFVLDLRRTHKLASDDPRAGDSLHRASAHLREAMTALTNAIGELVVVNAEEEAADGITRIHNGADAEAPAGPSWRPEAARRTGRTEMAAAVRDALERGETILVLVATAAEVSLVRNKIAYPLIETIDVELVTIIPVHRVDDISAKKFDRAFVDHEAWERYPFETAEALMTIRSHVKHWTAP